MNHFWYDRFIFKKVRDILGGNIRFIYSGGAPLAVEVHQFLVASFGCPVYECYGASELCGGICSTSAWDHQSGVVGGPLPCIKMKLRDLPELGYLSTDNPPRGEICVKGKSVFRGYFRNPELTLSKSDADGWFRMGDIGIFHPNGSLQVIDRVSSICKL